MLGHSSRITLYFAIGLQGACLDGPNVLLCGRRTYEKKKLVPKHSEPGNYDLWSQKDVVIDGRKKSEVFFAGLIVQKSYVAPGTSTRSSGNAR